MEKLPFLMFREHSSLEYALLILEKSSYKGAARDVTYTSVPGRSGDLLTDNGRYKNITIPYKLSLLNTTDRSFAVLAHQIRVGCSPRRGISACGTATTVNTSALPLITTKRI